ncbi:MAG: acyl--CoA ligase [Candidatus Korobacteraceae bacterium]|jgi:acyl-CoA synthetase (AMP-forming)/AMP-acid ligase II
MKPSASTLLDLLQSDAGNRAAIIVPETGVRVSYDLLRRQVLSMAEALAGAGIGRGDRVAIVLPNGLPAIVSFLAASLVGTAAPMNPSYRRDEFSFFLEDTGARLMICPPTGAEEARRAAQDRIPVLSAAQNAVGVVELQSSRETQSRPSPGAQQGSARKTPAPLASPRAEDTALILHTSGSTGKPKRVPLEHRNLAVSAANIAAAYALTPDDVSLCVMPLFHIHGLVASTLATLYSGGAVVVPAKFNPLAFWRLVREYGISWYSAVPTIHQLLLERAARQESATGSTLRFIRSCSSPLSPRIMEQMENAFGVPMLEAYGMTEAAHQMASNPLPPKPHKAGSVGMATGAVRISIMDEEGEHRASGECGEVVIKGPNVFRGYEGNANAGAFSDGWFRTGDEGFLDEDGYLFLTGRIKEMINRAGEKIPPLHIDEVLLRHPAVAEAVTFGFPHPVLGEEVAAAVVLRQQESEAVLLRHCRQHLAAFECPKKLHIVESIPRTATGKIQRSAVAEAILGKAA